MAGSSGAIGRQPNVERINYSVQSTDPSANVTGDIFYRNGHSTKESGLQLYNGTLYGPVNFRRENEIINGCFSVWQRNTSFNLSTDFRYADFWRADSAPGGTGTISRQQHTLGDIGGLEPTYFLRFTQGTVSGTLHTRLYDVNRYANRTYTWSFYARTSDSSALSFAVYQDFGTGGSPSASVQVTTVTSATTSSWPTTRYQVTATFPSISGKTLGSNGDHHIRIYLTEGSGTGSATKDFSLIMMNEGTVAADYIIYGGSPEANLFACKRRYQKSYEEATFAGNTTTTGSHIVWAPLATVPAGSPIEFGPEMRISPTMAFYATTSGTVGNWRNDSTAADMAWIALTTSKKRTSSIDNAAPTQGDQLRGHWTAEAE